MPPSFKVPQKDVWCSLNVKEVLENDPEAYYSKEELLENLLIMHKSLEDTKDNSIANGKLLDVIRQVQLHGPLLLREPARLTACWEFVAQQRHPQMQGHLYTFKSYTTQCSEVFSARLPGQPSRTAQYPRCHEAIESALTSLILRGVVVHCVQVQCLMSLILR